MELSKHEELASGPAFTDEDRSTATAGSGAGPMDEEEGRGGETKEDEDDLAGGDDADEDEEEDEDEDEDDEDEDDEDIVQDLLGNQRSESSLGGTLDALMGRVQPEQATDLTTSTLDALQQTENKVVGLLEIAAQTATELARVDATDETRDRLRSHIDTFLATTHEIHQTLREQIKLIPPALPCEGHSYDAKMDFEITKMQTHSVRARLGRLLAHIEQQQLAFQQQATNSVV